MGVSTRLTVGVGVLLTSAEVDTLVRYFADKVCSANKVSGRYEIEEVHEVVREDMLDNTNSPHLLVEVDGKQTQLVLTIFGDCYAKASPVQYGLTLADKTFSVRGATGGSAAPVIPYYSVDIEEAKAVFAFFKPLGKFADFDEFSKSFGFISGLFVG